MYQELKERLLKNWDGKIEINEGKDFFEIITQSEILFTLMEFLKKEFGFNYLANLCGVDYGEKFTMVYHVCRIPENLKVCVKADIPRDNPEIDSLTCLWPAADFQEREVYDLMGIVFKGHPDLKRILLPEDFEGHPLRKDYKAV